MICVYPMHGGKEPIRNNKKFSKTCAQGSRQDCRHKEHPNTQQIPAQYRTGQQVQAESLVDSVAHAQKTVATVPPDDSGDEEEDPAVAYLGKIEA
jgi:hypothetical protein